MTQDLVSIVMPMYNSAQYIEETIDSVKKQSYKNWELIIVDDKSDDNSVDIVQKKVESDTRIKIFLQKKNMGTAEARNLAVSMSDGKYIAFLDSDDIWNENKLTLQIKYMKANNIDFLCSYYGKIDETGKNLHYVEKTPKKMKKKNILTNVPGNSTVIYNKNNLGKTYIPNIRKRNDYIMWLRIIEKAHYIYCYDKVLAYHRVRSDSISANKLSLFKYHWIIYRKYQNMSIIYSFYILAIIVLKAVVRQVLMKTK